MNISLDKEEIDWWREWMRNPKFLGSSAIDIAALLLQEPLYLCETENKKAEIRFLALFFSRIR